MSFLHHSFKTISALIMLVTVAVLGFTFGLAGFFVGVVLSLIASSTFSRREKEHKEQQRHEEIIQSIKEGKTEL